MGFLDVNSMAADLSVEGFFGVLFLLYFLPTLVAFKRSSQVGSVIAINIFLGWTLLGWVVALALALSDKRRPATVTMIQPVSSAPILSPDNRYWWDGQAWRQLAADTTVSAAQD